MDDVKELIVGSFKVVSTELGNCETNVSIPLGGFVSQFGLVSVPLEEVILEMIGNCEGYEGQFSFPAGLLLFSLVFDGTEGILKSQSLDTAAFYCKYTYI